MVSKRLKKRKKIFLALHENADILGIFIFFGFFMPFIMSYYIKYFEINSKTDLGAYRFFESFISFILSFLPLYNITKYNIPIFYF